MEKGFKDKLAHAMIQKGSTGWTCSLFRDTRSKGNMPYRDTDFDFLWIHIDTDRFYLIPACALARRGILSSSFSKGRTGIVVYPFGCAKDADMWTDDFQALLQGSWDRG